MLVTMLSCSHGQCSHAFFAVLLATRTMVLTELAVAC